MPEIDWSLIVGTEAGALECHPAHPRPLRRHGGGHGREGCRPELLLDLRAAHPMHQVALGATWCKCIGDQVSDVMGSSHRILIESPQRRSRE